MSDRFRFKQFDVCQDRCAMKVGTDAVLLGSWATAVNPHRILDIGTGTGVLALMLAQRFPAAMIDAVDIDPDAVDQATDNFHRSPWPERLNAEESHIQQFRPPYDYNLIVSNPPFFHRSLKPDRTDRRIARHDDSLPLNELAAAVQRLLSLDGIFCVILPMDRVAEFSEIADGQSLFCIMQRAVRPIPQRPPKRCLMKFMRDDSQSVPEEPPLTVELSRHEFSPDYAALAKEFLLKL